MTTTLNSRIVGSTFHPPAPEIIGRLKFGTVLELKREPDNKYDHNAVAVWHRRTMLGYVPRGLALTLGPILDRGVEMMCTFVKVPNQWGAIEIVIDE